MEALIVFSRLIKYKHKDVFLKRRLREKQLALKSEPSPIVRHSLKGQIRELENERSES